MDQSTTLAELKRLVAEFVAERDWAKFHSPKNLSTAIAIEAAELMELFTWLREAESDAAAAGPAKQAASDELADIVIFAIAFANRCDIDLSQAIIEKLNKNRQKYPADEYRGRV